MSDILWGKIKEEIQDYEDTELDYNPSFASTQPAIIELINYYWNSIYRDGDTDSSNYKKHFYNIVEHASETASKMIDLDTKDIKIIAENGQSYYPAWLLSKELKLWMKEKKNKNGKTFGQFLNQLVISFPKYGHLIVKKAKDTVHLVPIENIINMPGVESILTSDYIIEKHEYTPEQLRKESWDNIEAVIKKYEKDGIITIYERFGKDDDGYNYHIIPMNGDDDNILFKDNVKLENLYKELKWDDISGRALGRGQVEKLFENQIAKNTIENLLKTGLRWTSKHIFQTRDTTVNKNLLTDVENGDLLFANSEIIPIAVEERNLPAYNFLDDKWDKNTRDKAFMHEPLSGERPPAGTPLGTTILQTKMAGMYYDFKREELAMFIKEILWDWIFPEFKKQKRAEHVLTTDTFDEMELDKFNGMIFNNIFNKAVSRQIKRTNKIPSLQERELLKGIIGEQIKSKKELKIPEGYYDDLKYKIDIVITGEMIDPAAKLNALERILVTVGQNPTLLQNKSFRSLLFQSMDMMGISPTAFEDTQPTLQESVNQRGGSVARIPAPTGMPMSMNVPVSI